MPHLTSDALRDDPEGLAFLRAVLSPVDPADMRREPLASLPVAAPTVPPVLDVEIVREVRTAPVPPLTAVAPR